MNELRKFNKKAFTLAEVLITLVIIGVIAVLVIPPLVKNYQKTQYVAGLKKACSEFQQGIKLYMADQGTTDLSQTDLFTQDGDTSFQDSTTRQAVWDSVMKKYFKIIRTCNVGDTSCLMEGTYLNYAAWDPNYEFGWENHNYEYNFFTADGVGFEVSPDTQGFCTPDPTIMGNLQGWCAEVYIDINGVKPPNKKGRDYFSFVLGANGNLEAAGGMAVAQADDDIYWQTGSGEYWRNDWPWACGKPGNSVIPDKTDGEDCAARIIENGWQMDY